jgi:Protein of unknown function (DUF4232)
MIAPPRPTSHDELEALIKEARARQLRRRLLGAAGVAAAAAFTLGVYALTSGGGNRHPTNSSSPSAGAPLCRASQLTAALGFQGATQTMLGGVTLTNRSGAACSLPAGPPTFRILWHGTWLAIPVRRTTGSTAPPWPPARRLAPDRGAFIVMQWFGLPVIGGALPPRRLQQECNRILSGPKLRPLVELRFRDGLGLRARATGLTLPACGPLHSSWLDVGRPLILQ